MLHTLKIEDVHYDNIISGANEFEVRYNDRDYQKGDTIKFTLVSGVFERDGVWKIKHIHSGYGMASNFVILGIERETVTTNAKGEGNEND